MQAYDTITEIARRLECSWSIFFSSLAIKTVEQRICWDNGWADWDSVAGFWWVWTHNIEFWMVDFDRLLWWCDYYPHGDNNYELRHMGKDKALRDGRLPEILIPSDDALELFDMMGGAWEQQWRGRLTMMSTSPSIANDSTTLCFAQLGCN